jgi:bifunctional UDP-N-acetylglucosamine pyrophosphorylase/glucosamine-1-phosphate N-acetyltransferase
MSGDVPLSDVETVLSLAELRRESNAPIAVGSMVVGDPTGYGRILQRDGVVRRIVEEKDATEDEREIQLVNGGLYAFEAAWLRERIGQIKPSTTTGELYLTSLVGLADEDGRPAVTWTEEDAADEWTLGGINDRVDLEEARYFMQAAVVERLQLSGVTVEGSGSVIDATVIVEPDVTLEANVALRGQTRIGRDTVVKSGSQVIDSEIGERCVIWSSVVEDCRVGNDVNVGPFAHLRAGCAVGDGAEIGNYAEQKNTRFGARSKQHHFSYLGDADIGEDVNIGAGTITANFDGRQKHKTVIGDRAFIGSDTILRAPITVGEGSYTGAGSVVTKDVPPGKLAVGVPARIRERRARPDDPEIRER